jgi:hypothetical protein
MLDAFLSYLQGGEKIADTLNQLGFDAMTLGNHEFDRGDDFVGDFVSANTNNHLVNELKSITDPEPYIPDCLCQHPDKPSSNQCHCCALSHFREAFSRCYWSNYRQYALLIYSQPFGWLINE